MKRRLFGLVLACLVAGCQGNTQVARGEWGGPNAGLAVTASGATATFKCGATGSVAQPLVLEAGAFDVPGTFTSRLVQGGPQPARYEGTVSGEAMTLRLTVAGQPAGTFQLTHGQAAQMEVCNF